MKGHLIRFVFFLSPRIVFGEYILEHIDIYVLGLARISKVAQI